MSDTETGREEPYLSLVIPVYNGAAYVAHSIETALRFLDRQGYPFELIVVDDGSADGTRAALAPHESRLRVLANDRNRGKGHAVRRGVLAARGRYIVFTDADLPFTLEPLSAFLQALEQGADMVIGWRDPVQSAAMMRPSLIRRVGSHLFTFLVSRFAVPGISDTQCGLKGFRRAAAHALFAVGRIDRFAFDVELLHLARKRRLAVTRLPVRLVDNGPSSVRPFRDGVTAAKDLLRIMWHDRLGHYQ